eukprot:6469161-Amphidinium_carterae.4
MAGTSKGVHRWQLHQSATEALAGSWSSIEALRQAESTTHAWAEALQPTTSRAWTGRAAMPTLRCSNMACPESLQACTLQWPTEGACIAAAEAAVLCEGTETGRMLSMREAAGMLAVSRE